jgi:hypothetical protein
MIHKSVIMILPLGAGVCRLRLRLRFCTPPDKPRLVYSAPHHNARNDVVLDVVPYAVVATMMTRPRQEAVLFPPVDVYSLREFVCFHGRTLAFLLDSLVCVCDVPLSPGRRMHDSLSLLAEKEVQRKDRGS